MDRPQRAKKPTSKVQTDPKPDEEIKNEPIIIAPPKYKLPDPVPQHFLQPAEIPKSLTLVKADEETGERHEFYKLVPNQYVPA